MSSLEKLPPEILRAYLISMRAVSRLFCQLITPILFQHVIIFSGNHVIANEGRGMIVPSRTGGTRETGAARLERLSMDPSLRKLVRRLEFCVKRERFYYHSYDREYKEQDRDLKYLARIATAIHIALPRFPNLEVLKLDFEDSTYSFAFDFDADHNHAVCWEQDTARFFQSFSTAICRSGLDKLGELDLSLPIAYDFGHFLDNEHEVQSSSARAVFKQLKRLRIHYGHNTLDDQELWFRSGQPNGVYNKYVRELLPLAPNLDSFRVQSPEVLSLDTSALPHSDLSGAVRWRRLLFIGVYLEPGTWEDILMALSETSITSFHVEFCGYAREGEAAQHIPDDDS
ncbi:hypothetical protein F53441_10687 [Fusarium austroafricanum]|uniref:Uncharacterized protein n=1 Tax=Fusarium austroafricanum TaxID=2364996 RepID=A0A8H4NUA8_9HYPO|nr:hypothetical protein F53441_10687 [Fusarium austroafricanum]